MKGICSLRRALALTLVVLSVFSSARPLRCREEASGSDLTVKTSLGSIRGQPLDGATRFTIPYAQPPVGQLRFANPQPILSFSARPDGSPYDASKTPYSCMQAVDAARGGNEASEDCLYSTFYVPDVDTAKSNKLPVLVWLPGGSFIGGSATNAGLDGTRLAKSQQVIVAVVQYRLGAFGWLQTNETVSETAGGAPGEPRVAGNQALRDVVAALTQLQSVVASFGGDPSRVTVMGQSSGAHMTRALLTLPAAKSLFSRAVLISDAQNYGASSQAQANALGSLVMESLGCPLGDLACAREASAEDVLYASYGAFRSGPAQDPSMAAGEPFRPTLGSYLSTSLEKQAAAGRRIGKDILISTVKNEAGTVIGANFRASSEQPSMLLTSADAAVSVSDVLEGMFNAGRGTQVAQSSNYRINTSQADGARRSCAKTATDGLWLCAAQLNARSLAKNGDRIFLSQSLVGSTYPSNRGLDFCEADGRVCHEDDILLVFGTYPKDSPQAVVAASSELQTRLANFARGGDPNAASLGLHWDPVQAGDDAPLNVLTYQADGKTRIDAQQAAGRCGGAMWGGQIAFDWQKY